MSRHNNNSPLDDVIDPTYEKSSRKNKQDQDDKRHNNPGSLIKDPIRCPMCYSVLMCPRNKDYDEFIEAKNLKCLSSNDPVCEKAVKNSSNANYIARIQSKK